MWSYYTMEQRKCSQCYLQCSECMSMALTMVQDNCTSSCTLNHCYKGSSFRCIGNGETTQEPLDLFTKDGLYVTGWLVWLRTTATSLDFIAIEISVDHIIEFGNILGYFVYL